MNHLIIGNGNMGHRHGLILEHLGDSVIWVDKNLGLIHVRGLDSILICTPPDKHFEILKKINNLSLPVFIEKPVFVKNEKLPKNLPIISHVADNWHWCPHLPKKNFRLEIGYQAGKFGKLDAIHFIDDLKSDKVKYNKYNNIVEIKKSRERCIILYLCSPRNFTILNGKQIDHNCSMFMDQMIYWRELIQGKIKSLNDIKKSAQYTNWLIKQW